jgi:hypothetical protein
MTLAACRLAIQTDPDRIVVGNAATSIDRIDAARCALTARDGLAFWMNGRWNRRS